MSFFKEDNNDYGLKVSKKDEKFIDHITIFTGRTNYIKFTEKVKKYEQYDIIFEDLTKLFKIEKNNLNPMVIIKSKLTPKLIINVISQISTIHYILEEEIKKNV
jgi:hypothetical protein